MSTVSGAKWIEAIGEVASYHARQKSDFGAIKEALNFLKSEGKRFAEKVDSNSSSSVEREMVSAVTVQISRIHDEALNGQNPETAQDASFAYIEILPNLLALREDDQLVVEYFGRVRQMANQSLRRRITDYAASYLWFSRIAMGGAYEKIWRPPIERIDFLSATLQQFAFDIVEFGNEKALQSFVTSILLLPLWDTPLNLRFRLVNRHSLHEDLDAIDKIGEEADRIENKALAIRTSEQLTEWEEELKNFVSKLALETKRDVDISKEQHEAIRMAWSNFLRHKIWKTAFYIGAFCLFKKKYSLLDILWNTKQPKDSDANWLGHNIFPETVRDLLVFHALEEDHGGGLETWEGRHSTRIYIDYYFLILLGRLLPSQSNSEDPCSQEGSIVLTDRSIMDLFQIEMELKQLLEKSKSEIFEKLAKGVWPISKQRSEVLSRLRLALDQLQKCAKTHLVTQEGTTRLNEAQVSAALADIETGYNRRTKLIGFLTQRNLLNVKDGDAPDPTAKQYSSRSMLPRGLFLPNWHTVSLKTFDYYGEHGAANEEDVILQSYLRKSRQVELDEAIQILREREPTRTLVFLDSTRLLLRRNRDFVEFGIVENSQVGSFEKGWLKLDSKEFEFFDIGTISSRNKLVVLFFENMPVIQIWDARSEFGEPSVRVGHSVFGFVDLASPKLDQVRKNYIDKPPAWLKEKGGSKEQDVFLQTQLILEQAFKLSIAGGAEYYGISVQLD